MNYINYLWIKIRLIFIYARVRSAKNQMLSEIQNSRNTIEHVRHSYRQFIELSSKQEQIAVSMRCLNHKKTNCPIPCVKIDTGYVSVSLRAQKLLTDYERKMALTRHRNGDWGEPSAQNWRDNNEAVRYKMGKLLSRYPHHNGGFFLIETDLRIPKTNILLEDERV